MRDRLTAEYTEGEKILFAQHNNPSPQGARWKKYLEIKLQLMRGAMQKYATRKYARLSFDKYVQAQSEQDCMARKITKNSSALLLVGGAKMSPNMPFGIPKGKRCPGTRRFMASVKKLGNGSDVWFVNEEFTSQTCANCHRKFPMNTRPHRFKVCRECPRNAQLILPMPQLIVTKKNRKRLRAECRELDRPEALEIWTQVIQAKENITESDRVLLEILAEPFALEQTTDQGRFGLRKSYFRKNWHRNPEAVEEDSADAAAPIDEYYVEDLSEEPMQPPPQDPGPPRAFSIVWHRDISAALCIMYKGKCIDTN